MDGTTTTDELSIAQVVRRGLTAAKKRLPPFLFYDDQGSRLFECITALPEYYLSRTERGIFERSGDAIAEAIERCAGDRFEVLELGAGDAVKSQVLLRAFVRRRGACVFHPADVSPQALRRAAARIREEEPGVEVRPWVATHEAALRRAHALERALAVLFIGSSIGNYDDDDAAKLLRGVRETIRRSGALLLATDLRKPLDVLLPAYDDPQGVTAAFNKNVLSRINRELGGRFDLGRFRHVASWNEDASAVEMHLESTIEQAVLIEALGLRVSFAKGERIHTESSHKYDGPRVDRLLARAGLARDRTFEDERGWFAVHVARAA